MSDPTPVVIKQKLLPGIGYTSKIVTIQNVNGAAPNTKVDIWYGFAYGFMLVPISSTSQPYAVVEVRGVGKIGNDNLIIVPNMWYDCPFDALKFVGDKDNPLISFSGTYIVNIAVKPYAKIYPVQNQANTNNYPASQGGIPPQGMNLGGETQALTRAAPTLSTEGTSLDEVPNVSAYVVTVSADSGAIITGGSIDIWRYHSSIIEGVGWVLMAQQVSLPTGARRVSIPWDTLGPHNPSPGLQLTGGIDRFLAATNGVTVSAGTTVSVVWRLQ